MLKTMTQGLSEIQSQLLQNLVAEYQNNDLLKASLQEAYETELKLIELDLGQPIDQATASFETMDEKQKEVFLTAIQKVNELNTEFNKLSEKRYMEIVVQYTTENGVTPPKPPRPETETFAPDMRYATGGIIAQPHIGLVGEAGAEAIIPLTGSNKKHGISLWKQAGEYLGMFSKSEKIESIQAHAQGGIFGTIPNNPILNSPIYEQVFSDDEETDSKQTSSHISAPIDIGDINLGGINFTFNGTGNMDKEGIMQVIRQQMPEIANSVAEEIAKGLEKFFANMKSNIT